MTRIAAIVFAVLIVIAMNAGSDEQWIVVADDDFSNTGFWETAQDENLAVFYNEDGYQLEIKRPMPSLYGIFPQTPSRVMGGFRASVTFALHEQQVIGIALNNAETGVDNPTGWVMAFAQTGGHLSLVHGHIDQGFTTAFQVESNTIRPGELIKLTLTLVDDRASVALNDHPIRSNFTIAQPLGFQVGLAFQSTSPDAPITITRFVHEILKENN